MNITIDNIIYYLQKHGGISVYFSELTKRLLKSENDLTFIDRSEEANQLRAELDCKNVQVQSKPRLKLARYLLVKQKQAEKYFFVSSYYRRTKDKNAINVTVVHDFAYEKFSKGLKKIIHHRQKKQAVKHSDIIICISENTKKDLLHYFPWAKNKQIEVIYNGAGEEFFPCDKTMQVPESLQDVIGEKYILYIGSRAAYKNFDKAVEAVSLLPKEYHLVAVGSPFTEKEKDFIKPISDRTHLIKFPTSDEINILYNYAHCLLYPSSYEGFGIPVVEAMRAGCPVVALNASSIPEVAGGCALLTDLPDADSIVAKIIKLEDLELRQEIIEKALAHSLNFTWDKTYMQLINVLKSIKDNSIV